MPKLLGETRLRGVDCHSLSSLPDISKWNMENIIDINSMFEGCSSLSALPNTGKWNIINVQNLNYLFFSCTS